MKLNRFLVVILYFLLLHSQAQDFAATGDDIEWSEGQVTLTKGQTLKGVVRFNSKTGLLSFNDGKESKVLTPRNIISFEYFDAIRQMQRKFYSLEVEDVKGIMRPQFFEVLKELGKFAVIATENPIELKKKSGYDPFSSGILSNEYSSSSYTTKTVASQVEVLYLIDMEGDINPYMTITNEERSRNFSNNTKSKASTKVVGEEFLEKLTVPHYAALKQYAKDSKLSFKDRGEFIKILDYYKQLESKE